MKSLLFSIMFSNMKDMFGIVLIWLTAVAKSQTIEGELLGNPLSGTGTLATGGRRIWIDTNVELKSGSLSAFHFYVGDITNGDPLEVKLQIWTPLSIDGDVKKFRLKWEKRQIINPNSGNKLFEVPIPLDERVSLEPTDRLGFTSVSDAAPVAMTFNDLAVTLFASYSEVSVGATVATDPIGYPAKFALAVVVGEEQEPEPVDGIVYCGNLIEPSTKVYSGSASWIDQVVSLKTGLVTSVKLYAPSIPADSQADVSVQVWLQTADDTAQFTLAWQRRLEIAQVDQILQFDIPASESILVNSSCRLGWTFSGQQGPIAYKFDPQHQSIRYSFSSDADKPVPGQKYSFDGIAIPSRFMIGLYIDTAPVVAGPPPSDVTESHVTSHNLSDITTVTTLMPNDADGGSTSAAPHNTRHSVVPLYLLVAVACLLTV